MSSSSFDVFCFQFQRSGNLFSFIKKKEFILSLFSVYSFKKSPDFGPSRIILWKNNLGAHRVDFAAFFCAIKNWWEKPCVSHVVKYTIRWESDGKKCTHPLGEKIGTNFPGSSNSMYFTALSHATGNWWGNPCILHIIKYTIGCESNGKKAPKKVWVPISQVLHIRWALQDFPRNQFYTLFPFYGFSCLFPCYGKLMRKPMHFPYDEVYHRMGI